jgi:hypothetical protein
MQRINIVSLKSEMEHRGRGDTSASGCKTHTQKACQNLKKASCPEIHVLRQFLLIWPEDAAAVFTVCVKSDSHLE